MRKDKRIIQLHEMSDGLYAVKGRIVINQNAQIEGYFYIDTGSTINLIRQNRLFEGKRHSFSSIVGLGNTSSVTKEYYLDFSIENRKPIHNVSFFEVKDDTTKEWDYGVIGVIGYTFLKHFNYIIDFDKKRIFSYDAFLFMKPKPKMKCRFQNNHSNLTLPVISISDGVKCYSGIIDSGSVSNIISSLPVIRGDICCQIIDPQKSVIAGINSSSESISSIITFFLISSSGVEKETMTNFTGNFDIMLSDESLLSFEGETNNIDILLGIEFLKKNKCIIDCRRGVLGIN